jgi:uncharacterized damage-inducible protein DinB
MTMSFEAHYLADLREQFAKVKEQSERALAQVSEEELTRTPDSDSNSLAVLVRHMAGNLRSRFTDFLTTDGEKPDRNRDGEFETAGIVDRASLMAQWERGWSALFTALDALTPADLMKDVYIRGQRHTVIQALHRAFGHQSQHAGQIVFLAKLWRAGEWKTLSLPKKVRS